MEIRSYSKILALGHRDTADILKGEFIIEEKIDGSQFSFGKYNGELACRSNGKQIVMDAPGMFDKAVETVRQIGHLLTDGWTYRGEYLQKPKHNTLAYSRIPAKHIIIWDIDRGNQDYLPQGSKWAECCRIGLECVPRFVFDALTPEVIDEMKDTESVLGGVKIEGVVIKNYGKLNSDGKILMAKVVSEEFKEKHSKDWKDRNPGQSDIIQIIGQNLRTEARWQKAIQHLKENGFPLTDSPKDIGPLLKEINQDILKEEEQAIKDQLFKWAWGKISRISTAGFPEWYKQRTLAEVFDGPKKED